MFIKHGLGVARTTATEVIFFPLEYGGYGILDLHLEKVAEQTRYIVQHVRNGDSLGRRIKICLETAQLEAAINELIERSGRIFRIKHITPTILTELIRDLWEMKAEICLDHWVPELGTTIMDIRVQQASNNEQVAELNFCRIWSRVHYTSDLTTVDGRKIHPGYQRDKRVRESKWQ